jgi:hypothetical protein
MMFRRFIDWLHGQWVRSPIKPIPAEDKLALDIDEFARLLQSGKPEDMATIARAFGRPDKLKI